jgi:hypothetical protein
MNFASHTDYTTTTTDYPEDGNIHHLMFLKQNQLQFKTCHIASYKPKRENCIIEDMLRVA